MSLYDLLRAGNVTEFNATRPARSTMDLFAVDLSHLKLCGVNLTNANLEKADFTGTDLTGAVLHRANLSGADFTDATLDGCDATRAKLREAFMGDARAVGANFTGADLGEADLTGINARNANFEGARLKEAVLQNAHLTEAVFREARLGDADLRGAELERSVFTAAELPGANLSGARLNGADFGTARMAGAALRHADLTGANFSNADLSNADLTGATTTDARWTGADLFDAKVDPTVALAAKQLVEPTENIDIFVEEPSVAVGPTHVGFVWENADGEDVLTLRAAVVLKGGKWDGRALPLGVPGDQVIARALVPSAQGFSALLFLERAGACSLIVADIHLGGAITVSEPVRLAYQPAVTPIVGVEAGHIYVYGISKQGTLAVHEWTGGALHERVAGPAGSWRGFCSRHYPVLLGKGGTLAFVRSDGIGAVGVAPTGFPGRLQAACPHGDDDRLAMVWTQKGETGVRVALGGASAHLHRDDEVACLDLWRDAASTVFLWMLESDQNEPYYEFLEGGRARRLRDDVATDDAEEVRFACSTAEPAAAISTSSGGCFVVGLAPNKARLLARIGG